MHYAAAASAASAGTNQTDARPETKKMTTIRSGLRASYWGLKIEKRSPLIPFYLRYAHRSPTLALYKSMLKAAKSVDNEIHKSFLVSWVRERWRFHRHDTSPQKTIQNILEAEETLGKILKASKGDPAEISHIDDLAWGRKGRLQDVLNKIKTMPGITTADPILSDVRTTSSQKKDPSSAYAIPLPQHLRASLSIKSPRPRRVRTPRPRKAYQVAYMAQDSTGRPFFRIRGYRQPLWVSLKIKHRVIKAQNRVDNFRISQELLDEIRAEETFWRSLNCRDWWGWAENLTSHLNDLQAEHNRLKTLRFDGKRGKDAFQELENTGF